MTRLAPRLLLIGTLACATAAQAATLAQWNFNSQSTTASSGVNAASSFLSVIGGATSYYASQSGSSDGTAGGYALNLTSFPTQGTGDKTAGLELRFDTTGYSALTLNFDQRVSNTGSRYTAVQYTLDGSTWSDFAVRSHGSPDAFENGASYDFSTIAGAANNSQFGIRLVSTFAPGQMVYEPANNSKNYGVGGTMRYDMITLSGEAVSAVPEPANAAMLLLGLLLVGTLASRHHKRD